MKNQNLFKKIVFIVVIVIILFTLVAPVIFSQAVGAPKQERLLNGLKVLMWSDGKADKVWVSIRIHAGSAFDPQGKEGTMQMLADNIFPNEASKEFFTDDLGGHLEITTTYDFIQIDASSKPESEAFLSMLETLAAAVSNPTIDKETTAKLRLYMLAKIKGTEGDVSYLADHASAERLFGTFPYGRPILGTTSSVQKIDFADLIDARERFLTADNATITVSGNFDRSLGFKAIRRYFGNWLKSDKKIPSTFRQPDEPPTAVLTLPSPDTTASAVRIAFRGTSRGEKDFASSMVFARVMQNRLKATQGGDVWVKNAVHTLPGVITIGTSSARAGAKGKLDVLDAVTKALADPVLDAEFQSARAALQTEWATRRLETFWLDADTFRTGEPAADSRAIENVSITDVRTYAEKARKLPLVTVVVAPPTT